MAFEGSAEPEPQTLALILALMLALVLAGLAALGFRAHRR